MNNKGKSDTTITGTKGVNNTEITNDLNLNY